MISGYRHARVARSRKSRSTGRSSIETCDQPLERHPVRATSRSDASAVPRPSMRPPRPSAAPRCCCTRRGHWKERKRRAYRGDQAGQGRAGRGGDDHPDDADGNAQRRCRSTLRARPSATSGSTPLTACLTRSSTSSCRLDRPPAPSRTDPRPPRQSGRLHLGGRIGPSAIHAELHPTNPVFRAGHRVHAEHGRPAWIAGDGASPMEGVARCGSPERRALRAADAHHRSGRVQRLGAALRRPRRAGGRRNDLLGGRSVLGPRFVDDAIGTCLCVGSATAGGAERLDVRRSQERPRRHCPLAPDACRTASACSVPAGDSVGPEPGRPDRGCRNSAGRNTR